MSGYIGTDITIEELPQGCIISQIIPTGEGTDDWEFSGRPIVVSSKVDALELIESLERMLKIQFGIIRNDK